MNSNCDGGAPATTPFMCSSGAYDGPIWSVNAAVWPPSLWPHTT